MGWPVRRTPKLDANQNAIVAALRQYGATVQSLAAIGNGCPDILVGWRGKTAILEIKDGAKPPSKRALTPDQLDWHARWQGGTLAVVDNIESAIRVLRVMEAA